MGNCLRKKQSSTLGTIRHCQICNQRFPANTFTAAFNNHVNQCVIQQQNTRANHYLDVQPGAQQQQQQNQNHVALLIQHQPASHQRLLQRAQSNLQQPQPQPGLNPSQAIMDDFNTSLSQKYYWAKELVQDSNTKYTWQKKLIPQLPDKTVQGMMQIPWNTIKTAEYPIKQIWFRLHLEKLRIPWQNGSDTMHVSKESFLMSTLGAVHGINWHKEVKVIIAGEEKVQDAGGLLREWINLIMKEIIHPESGMFELAETEDVTYKINSNADPCDHVLDCFRLLGIVVGKAIFERIPINAFFDRTIIRHILGQPVTLDDIYFYDRSFYHSWQYLLNNDFDPLELMEYFVLYRRNSADVYELKQGGSEIMVNNENKQEYVKLCTDYLTYQSIKPFVHAFLNQLYTIIPKKLLSVFEPMELEMILYGIPFIDLQDWKENTEFKGVYYRNHQVIKWFWKVLETFDQPMLAKFLQFCTGSQRTPVEGFRKLESNRGNTAKFCIESIPFDRINPYPKAHTCFNRIELPIYENFDDLQMYLKAVVQNDLDGIFGLE